MRKRSILLSCIAALMVMAMFVGCDNGPVWPITSVKSGYINQIGDFLDGQAFDGSKFEIYVTYDNSSTPVLTTGTVYLEKDDGTVGAGDYVWAIAGTDVYGDEVYARVSATTYDVTTIDVALRNEAKVYAADDDGKITIPASDLKVVAHYLKDGQDKTMELNSTEFSLPDEMIPVFEDGATETSYTVTVTTKVGGEVTGTIAVKATTEPVVEPDPAELVSITAIYAKVKALPQLNYDEVPVPTWDDVSVFTAVLNTSEDNKSEALPEHLRDEVRLFYVDSTTKLEITNPNFVAAGTKGLNLAAEYNGKTIMDKESVYTVSPATVYVDSASIFDSSAFISGNNLPALADYTDDLTVTVKYGEKYALVSDVENVKFGYYTLDEELVPYTDTTVPEETLYIGATYRGASPDKEGSLDINVTPSGVTTYDYGSLTAELADSFKAPAKQYYDDITDVTDALSARDLVLTLTVNDKNVPIDSKNLKVYYSSTDLIGSNKFEPGDFVDSEPSDDYGNDALVSKDTIYAIAEYKVVTDASDGTTTVYYASAPVALDDPDPEDLELVVEPVIVNNVIGSDITFNVSTRNDLGFVDTEITDNIAVIGTDGKDAGDLNDLKVPAEDMEYEIRYTGLSSRTLTYTLELKAGVVSVNLADVTIRLKSNYKQLIDEKLDTNAAHYEAVLNEEVTTDVKIVSVDASSSTIVSDAEYDVVFIVEYTNDEGITLKERTAAQTLTATAWIDTTKATDFEVDGITEGTSASSYSLDDFTVVLTEEAAEKEHGTAEITTVSISDGKTTVTADSEESELTVEAGDKITVKFSYVGSNGTEKTLSLSVEVTE